MQFFKLPDLGEGLAEAQIHEWLVKEGDEVKADQPLVTVETAKAIVEVPSPQKGRIVKLHGLAGDVLATGATLVEFAIESEVNADKGSVVGIVPETQAELVPETAVVASSHHPSTARIKATPAVRLLAQQLHVDLAAVHGTGLQGTITADDVRHVHEQVISPIQGSEPLKGIRRNMAQTMVQSHANVVPVSLVDNADIHAFSDTTDVTVRVIRAMVAACQKVPALNAWFDGPSFSRQVFSDIHLGLAVDTTEGLLVPVIQHVSNYLEKPGVLRQKINEIKIAATERRFAPADFQGATITLSNFGTFAGKYANLIIVPPQVCIVGIGRARDEVVAYQGQVVIHKILPLSLTVDHRVVTGSEAAQFLAAMIRDLEQAE